MCNTLNISRVARGGKNHALQYLRAICALMVFFSHYCKGVNDPLVRAFSHNRFSFIADGAIAVSIFFVLSGFFYYKTSPMTLKSYLAGVRHKSLRIYPAHILVLVVGLICCNLQFKYDVTHFTEWGNSFWNNDATWSDLILGATCIFHRLADTPINPSAWYLEYEVILFLTMPLIVWGINKIGWRYAWVLIAISIIGLVLDLEMYNIINIVGICCIGVLARYLTTKYGFDFLQNRKWLIIWCMAGVLLLAHVYFGVGKVIMLLRGIGAAMIIIAFYKIKLPYVKWLVAFGNISFEIYLVQHIALLACRPLYVNAWVYLVISLVFTIIGAYILNICITKRLLKHNFQLVAK